LLGFRGGGGNLDWWCFGIVAEQHATEAANREAYEDTACDQKASQRSRHNF
jgi:hypothetical protein